MSTINFHEDDPTVNINIPSHETATKRTVVMVAIIVVAVSLSMFFFYRAFHEPTLEETTFEPAKAIFAQ